MCIRDRRYTKTYFDRLFCRLDAEQKHWQQALFMRLLFEFNVPASRLLKAQWGQFIEAVWYPWLPGEKLFRPWRRRHIEKHVQPIIEKLRQRNQAFHPESNFLFPSRESTRGHLTTFLPYWRKVANELSIPAAKLRTLIASYQSAVILPMKLKRAYCSWRL
jgi:hypothetical protein